MGIDPTVDTVVTVNVETAYDIVLFIIRVLEQVLDLFL